MTPAVSLTLYISGKYFGKAGCTSLFFYLIILLEVVNGSRIFAPLFSFSQFRLKVTSVIALFHGLFDDEKYQYTLLYYY